MTECAVKQIRVSANNTSPLADLFVASTLPRELSTRTGEHSQAFWKLQARNKSNPKMVHLRFGSGYRDGGIRLLCAVIFIFIDSSLNIHPRSLPTSIPRVV